MTWDETRLDLSVSYRRCWGMGSANVLALHPKEPGGESDVGNGI